MQLVPNGNVMNNKKDYKIEIHSINNEIIINIDNEPTKVFLQPGFYQTNAVTSNESDSDPSNFAPHIHNYTELHFFLGEEGSFFVDETDVTVSSGTMLSVPKNTYHVMRTTAGTRHCAFQIDLPIGEFMSFKLPTELIKEFFNEIDGLRHTNDHAKVANYISFFASYFIKPKELVAEKSQDYGFIIDSFLSLNYNKPIHLADLAEELHISVKQAERLVVAHTGYTFNTALTNIRISAAEHLMKSTSFSVSEISSLVGYESHSGFWKAYKRYRDHKKQKKAP